MTGCNPEHAAVLKSAKVFMGVMGMEHPTTISGAEPFPKLNVVRESLPIKIRLTPSQINPDLERPGNA